MKSFILGGGNPPISSELLRSLVREQDGTLRIVLLTLYREGWETYVEKKYIEPFKAVTKCNFEIVLGDKASIESIISSLEKADVLIIGGGDTILYHKTYCKEEIRDKILERYKLGIPVLGLSAGAIIMGDKIAISPKDNALGIPIYGKGIGIYNDFLVGVHYSKWNDRIHLERAKQETNSIKAYGIDDDSYVIFNEREGYRFLGSVHVV